MKYPALANPWAEKADCWLREAGRRGTREGVVNGVQGFLLVWHKVNSFRTGYRWWLLNTMNVVCVTEMHILWKGYYFHVSPHIFKTPAARTQFTRARPCVAYCLCVYHWHGRHTQICLLAVLEHCQNVKSNTMLKKKDWCVKVVKLWVPSPFWFFFFNACTNRLPSLSFPFAYAQTEHTISGFLQTDKTGTLSTLPYGLWASSSHLGLMVTSVPLKQILPLL